MNAVQFTSSNQKLHFSQTPIPKVTKPNDVLIKVAFAGVCGTDLHIITGEFPCKKTPFTLGHEFSGTIVEIGSGVRTLKKGDRVAVDPQDGCRCCQFCHMGKPHFCDNGGLNNTMGIYRDGGWAQYALVPEEEVFKIPEKVTLEQAVLIEPISCLAHACDIINPIHVGSKILMIGAGIIGNLWVCILHLQGHRNVTVSEPNQARLNMLKKLDCGYTLITPDQLKKNQQSDPNYLFDVVLDSSGFPPAIEHAVTLLQRGGKLCCFGVAPPNGRISVSPFDIFIKELSIYGVNINPFTFSKSIGLVEAMGGRYLNYDNLGIKTFALKDFKDAIEHLKKGCISKAVFKM